MTNLPGLIFTIEVDGRPTVAFEAKKKQEAIELCSEDWLRADLTTLTSYNAPVCQARSKLNARLSNATERTLYQRAAANAPPSDDLLLVYLVDLDREP
jgi:hypothetical protein